ncbi:Membrane magnesium transporter 1 [Quaeritorhiza haematococci]|nr:Membrane magnesium transporter 1 [Quaeritorhiza haematococci]
MAKTSEVSWLGRLVYTIGLIFLFHSGYSAVEHLAYVKVVGKSESRLPTDIVVECLLGLIVSSIGIVLVAGRLKPILLETEMCKK